MESMSKIGGQFKWQNVSNGPMEFGPRLRKGKEIDFRFRKSREGKEARAIKRISEKLKKNNGAHFNMPMKRK